MTKQRHLYPALSWIIAAGAIVIALDQILLWAFEVNVWARVWGIARTTSVIAFFWVLTRKAYNLAIGEIERNRKETAIGINRVRQQSEKLTMAGTLAAAIAHEIRNPITILRGFIQLHKTASKAHTDIMLTEIDRINGIIDELLVLAKPEEGEYARRELRPLLLSVHTLLNPQAILHNVQLIDQYSSQLQSIEVVCVENKLKQVFINVIKNAIEAMPDGGEIKVAVATDEGWVSIELSDDGPGIPQEMLERIGQPFISTKEKGTGLGLMVCQTILEDHGGTMLFQNQSSGGALVTIKLPIIRG
ncbi:MAG: two-component sensor histidine kinase [Cohnella sp.]|nr:two-component sensor histidine kinase [Cohnella sp.]